MKVTGILLGILICIVLVGMVAGAVSLEPEAAGSGNVYTTGSIQVVSTPAGASAALDGGRDQLISPGTFRSVRPGIHNVIIAKPGYQPWSENVEVKVGMKAVITATLSPSVNPGGISVSSEPKGAGLSIDGVNEGITNQIVGKLSPGPHIVTVRKSGYETWTMTVQVSAGRIAEVNAILVPERNPVTGDLAVTSDPAGASVYLDGNYQGITPGTAPLDLVDLSPGIHTVDLRRAGFEDYSASVKVEAGSTALVEARLKPVPSMQTGSASIVSTPAGADVYINNVFSGVTPLTFLDVTPGNYTVTIMLEGYSPYTSSGEMLPGRDIVIDAVLAPAGNATRSGTGPVVPFLVLVASGIILISRRKR